VTPLAVYKICYRKVIKLHPYHQNFWLKAKAFKEKGNTFFLQSNYSKALFQYNQAWLYLKGFNLIKGDTSSSIQNLLSQGDKAAPLSPELLAEAKALAVAVNLNMAACHLKTGRTDRAIEECNRSIELDKNNAKAYFRRGQAFKSLKDVDRSLEDLKKALQLAPNDRGIKAELSNVKKMENAQIAKQKRTFKGLFDKLAAEEESNEKEEVKAAEEVKIAEKEKIEEKMES